MVVIDRYIDNKREYEFELALEELEKEQHDIARLEQLQDDYNIGDPMKVYGAV